MWVLSLVSLRVKDVCKLTPCVPTIEISLFIAEQEINSQLPCCLFISSYLK